MSKLYIDYGTTIDADNMKRVCKSPTIYGKGVLEEWKSTFMFFANIVKEQDTKVPVVV